ncbi:MAG: HD domain-containing protein [Candidatus Nomurabacteria bacterium]|nr:HD domain-containing protein [Candidatus Nomurabacteria bacterium]
MTPETQGLVDIARLTFKFALVDRVTMLEDGEKYESDTDHTVMLAVCACALAEASYKDKLDIGKVAQFAIVHDLVEAYAGDTNSINITDENRGKKEMKEAESLKRIESELGRVYPWIHKTIEEYERLDTKEAQFVKTLDKVMPKISHTLNKGVALKKLGVSKEETESHFSIQMKEYKEKYGKEFPLLIDILGEFMNVVVKETYV